MKIKPMLGENLTNYPDSILDGKTWRMSVKIDGVRRLFYKDVRGFVTAESRTNIQDPWLTHITEFLSQARFPKDTVYDCELVDRELYFNAVPSFILRQNTNAKASQQYPNNKKDLMAVCFDIFKPGGDPRIAADRDELLYNLFNRGTPHDPIIRVPIYWSIYGADIETIKNTMQSVLDNNGEGLMLLDMESIYIPGRSRSLLKVKRVKEFIGKIIDIEMARPGTKIDGMVAAVICEVDGCTVPVRVGSGFNNAERMEMAINSPIGESIEIEAFSYSENRSGAVSLNHPIFKRFIK